MGFKQLLSAAGRAFLIAFGASALALSTAVLGAPNVDAAASLGVAALFASLAAGVKAVQVFVPLLSWSSLLRQPFAAWADAFTQGFVGALVVSLTNWLDAGSVSDWRAAATAAVVGALMAGLRALQGAVTAGEAPFANRGF
jgi:hypothetical protein